MSVRMSMRKQARVLIVGSDASMLYKFHAPLVRCLTEAGHRVELASPPGDKAMPAALESLGARWTSYPLSRTGVNPFHDTVALFALWRLIRRLKPEVTLCYTPKPVIYGGLAAWLAGVPSRYALITGLGYAFTGESRGRRGLVQAVVRTLYRTSLSTASGVLFQNPDDRQELVSRRILSRTARTAVFDGCGVDVDAFRPGVPPKEPTTFVMVGRLLADKGLREFAAAAREVRRDNAPARFIIVGGTDSNPEAVQIAEVESWVNAGDVEWTGPVSDVRPLLAASHVFVLPSYREGLPQSTLEAMASGLAVVTTDVPGCRETVSDGLNGLIVPARDAGALAEAFKILIGDPARIRAMGRESRRLAETRFESGRVSRAILRFVGLAGCDAE